MRKPTKHPAGDDERKHRIEGDPGVGGLLSDPLQPAKPHDKPDPAAGPKSPDPAPPRHHGDWMPARKDSACDRPGPRLAAIMRRKSLTGMPRALFREDDGTNLDDLRVFARTYRHHPAVRQLSAGRATIRRSAT